MTAPTRKWRFSYGYGTVGTLLQGPTDFWVEYKQSGEPGRLEVVLHACWDYAKYTLGGNSLDGFKVRTAVEDRLLALQLAVGRTGTLDIDYDQTTPSPSRARSIPNVVLETVTPTCADSNRLFEYDITFGWATAGQQVRVWGVGVLGSYRGVWDVGTNYNAGDIVLSATLWLAKQSNRGQLPANNAIWGPQSGVTTQGNTTFLLVPRTRPDRTAFKPVYRASDVRIPAAKGLETVKLTGIRQSITGGVDGSGSKTAAEAAIGAWVDQIGNEMLLQAGGTSYGLCHLQDVQPGRMDLPDAVTFELTFVRGYVNG